MTDDDYVQNEPDEFHDYDRAPFSDLVEALHTVQWYGFDPYSFSPNLRRPSDLVEAPTGGDTVGHGYGGLSEIDSYRFSGVDTADVPRYLMVPVTLWGDYCGDICGRSNCRSLVRDYPDTFVTVQGSHGSEWLVLPAAETVPRELVEVLSGLEQSYPLYDDEDHSELEHELALEAWGQYLSFDVPRELVEVLSPNGADTEPAAELVESFHDSTLERLFYESVWAIAEETNGETVYSESAVSVVFPHYDEIVERIGERLVTLDNNRRAMYRLGAEIVRRWGQGVLFYDA